MFILYKVSLGLVGLGFRLYVCFMGCKKLYIHICVCRHTENVVSAFMQERLEFFVFVI